MKNLFLYTVMTFTLIACGNPYNNEEEAKIKKVALIAKTNKLWKTTSPVLIAFADGTPEVKDEVELVAKEWTKYANIDFIFYPTLKDIPKNKSADIIITFNTKVNTSNIGTDSRHSSASGNSMNLALFAQEHNNIRRGIILHEFGHALGLEHEHQHKDRTIRFNEAKSLEYCKNDLGFSEESCRLNILNPLNGSELYFSKYDPFSIMHYSLHPNFFDQKIDLKENLSLSLTDKLEIAKLYPGRKTNEEIILGHEARMQELKEVSTYKNCKLTESLTEKFRPSDKGIVLTSVTELSISSIMPNEFNDNYIWEEKEATVIRMQGLEYCNLSDRELEALRVKKREEHLLKRYFGNCMIPLNEDGTPAESYCNSNYPYHILARNNKASVSNFCYPTFDSALDALKTISYCKLQNTEL